MGLSVVDKLLLAALSLVSEGKPVFSAEDLVISAWSLYPHTFGLTGHNDKAGSPRYPDSNRVFAEVMGSKPIRKRGLLRKVGTKRYELTETGLEHARSLARRVPDGQTEKASLSRETASEIRRLLTSKAKEKLTSGREEAITFSDACAFWGISPRSTAIELKGRFANLTRLLESAKLAVTEGKASFVHRGATFSYADVAQLAELNRSMKVKFSNELNYIANRTDERR